MLRVAIFSLGFSLLSAGCFLSGSPDKANIELRKKNQELEAQVKSLQTDHAAGQAMVLSLQKERGTLPTLPQDRLDRLFVVHDITFGRLSGGADLDSAMPGDEALRVYATPVDADGESIKATGAFTIEAFDPSITGDGKIGSWSFDVDAARKLWIGSMGRRNYVLTCPLQTAAQGSELHLQITFTDELTQAIFKKSLDVKVTPSKSSPG